MISKQKMNKKVATIPTLKKPNVMDLINDLSHQVLGHCNTLEQCNESLKGITKSTDVLVIQNLIHKRNVAKKNVQYSTIMLLVESMNSAEDDCVRTKIKEKLFQTIRTYLGITDAPLHNNMSI